MLIVFLGTLISSIFPQTALSQNTIHSVQIVGQKSLVLQEMERKERLVEYDPLSQTHPILKIMGQMKR